MNYAATLQLITCDNVDGSRHDPEEFHANLARSFHLQAWNFVLARSFSDYTPGMKLIVHVHTGEWVPVIVEEHIQYSRYVIRCALVLFW
jgi:hypothetical protein